MLIRLISSTLLFCLLFGYVSATRAESPVTQNERLVWLANMSKAMRELSYQGLLTYEFAGNLQSLRLTHRVADGLEYEQLEFLNGPDVRIERNGRNALCLSTGDLLLRGMQPLIDENGGLDKFYHFYNRGVERVAGREAYILHVVPKDNLRYGYSFSIDKETFLPLALLIMEDKRKAIERLQFLSLDLQPDDSWVADVGATSQVKSAPLVGCDREVKNLSWKPSWVPPGFVGSGRAVSESHGEIRTYTDGLAALSIFVLPMTDRVAAQGKAQRGATAAYMQQLQHNDQIFTITVVGEIPARTAQRIANSISWASANPVDADTASSGTPAAAELIQKAGDDPL